MGILQSLFRLCQVQTGRRFGGFALSARWMVKHEYTRFFSAHHDSALELKFLKGSQKWYGLKIIVPDAVGRRMPPN